LEKWSNGDGGIWLTSIPPTSAPDIAVYSFEHGIRPDEDFSWQSLFDQGAELLDVLIKLGDVAEVCVCSAGNKRVRINLNGYFEKSDVKLSDHFDIT
jgi:hypothetical protein